MQNWNTMQTSPANRVDHNNWYNNMFAANIKTEPDTQQHSATGTSPNASSSNHLENYIKQQQQQFTPMDTNMTTLAPSPTNKKMLTVNNSSNNNNSEQRQQHQHQQSFFETAGMRQQIMQQQHYQQHFQQAQQAAAQNQVTSHLPLGFNPLTPPGLPQAILPARSHIYNQTTQKQTRSTQQNPSPQTLLENSEKSTLTPSNTPPMDITPPKSPKPSNPAAIIAHEHQQDQELMSNSSEDLKCIAESDDDETIRLPIYNSHGKMKNYKCKSCGKVAITKLAFWEHAKIHMKPEKVLQCTKCPFVTELKHHLEYHIRKHKNLKPFQCDKCPYSCVNKSMLNSHRKSHSLIYPYRCAECDYATKYCHSFKLHLRKYDHKPGLVLDEEGMPNPSVVIDVYGTRRGPKNKGSSGVSSKKSNAEYKMSATSQLSAALQGFTQNQLPPSPAKSGVSVANDLPAPLPLPQQQQQQQQPSASSSSPSSSQSQSSPTQTVSEAVAQNGTFSNMLPPLATLLHQNHNMTFFPYWNLNNSCLLLAAQQQAAVLAQISPDLREQLKKYQMIEQNNENQFLKEMDKSDDDEDDENEDSERLEEQDQEVDRKSVDSAMDLSQGTPTKDDQQKQTPEMAINLKLPEENVETPLYGNLSSNRRKGRVLKLEPENVNNHNTNNNGINSGPQPNGNTTKAAAHKVDESPAAEEIMETGAPNQNHNNPSNTSLTSTASSSGNSSNSSSTVSSSNNSIINSNASTTPTMYECKYCDIFFKDAVLYTIHMGYHSCDDVFKCNMCGEKCDGPVGLFVHMARNAHS